MAKTVERWTWKIKVGQVAQAVELLKEEWEGFEGCPQRVYTSWFGPGATVMWEGEFESMDERKEYWVKWPQHPRSEGFTQEFQELVDSIISRELWHLP